MDNIARALKAKVHAAKTGVLARAPKLLAEFEGQMELVYPPSGDPVWADALNKVMEIYRIQNERVEERCRELRKPERFRPSTNTTRMVIQLEGCFCQF